MGNQNNDIYGCPDDPARIKHERYNAGISCGKKYLEASVEQGKNWNIEPSLNAGLKSSSSKTKPFYSEQGTNEEISLSKGGFKNQQIIISQTDYHVIWKKALMHMLIEKYMWIKMM